MLTFLSGIELGNKKSSQLLREMRTLAGENATEGLLRILWQQRLPTCIQEMLLIFDDANLNKLAECADKFHEHSSPVDIYAAQTTPTSAQGVIDAVQATSTDLQDTIQQLAKQMTTLLTRMDKTDRRSQSPAEASHDARATRTIPLRMSYRCYYNRRFGDQVQKCIALCSARAKVYQENE